VVQVLKGGGTSLGTPRRQVLHERHAAITAPALAVGGGPGVFALADNDLPVPGNEEIKFKDIFLK